MIVTNTGGPINLPDLALSPGDNVVAPQTWNRVKDESMVKAFLGSGRLATDDKKREPVVVDEPVAASVVEEPVEESVPEEKADYSELSAKAMIALVATMTEAQLDGLVDEGRKTVLTAIESRYDELLEDS